MVIGIIAINGSIHIALSPLHFWSCYNLNMPMKDELKAYRARWESVEATVAEQRRLASYELRWQQLNSIYAIAIGFDFEHKDSNDAEVFELWAKLKS